MFLVARGAAARLVAGGAPIAAAVVVHSYFWARSGDPRAFVHAEDLPIWQRSGPTRLSKWPGHVAHAFSVHATLLVVGGLVAVAVVALVARRFGRWYAAAVAYACIVAALLLGAQTTQSRIQSAVLGAVVPVVGLLVWGFDSRPVLMVPYDPPYAGSRVEGCGYAKIKDLFSYDYDVQNAPETIGAKLMARAGMAGRVKVRTANMKMFDAEVRTLVGIFNDAWSDNWGFVPFTQAEIDHAAKAFGPVIVPDLAVFVEVDDEAVAFIVALTNLNEAIAEFNGSLNPINLVKLLWRLKIAGVGSTRVPLMGVKKKFRNHPLMGAGLAMMAIDHLRANGKRLGKTSAELGWILEDNKATNNIIRSVGGVHYKTHRIYEKTL